MMKIVGRSYLTVTLKPVLDEVLHHATAPLNTRMLLYTAPLNTRMLLYTAPLNTRMLLYNAPLNTHMLLYT